MYVPVKQELTLNLACICLCVYLILHDKVTLDCRLCQQALILSSFSFQVFYSSWLKCRQLDLRANQFPLEIKKEARELIHLAECILLDISSQCFHCKTRIYSCMANSSTLFYTLSMDCVYHCMYNFSELCYLEIDSWTAPSLKSMKWKHIYSIKVCNHQETENIEICMVKDSIWSQSTRTDGMCGNKSATTVKGLLNCFTQI